MTAPATNGEFLAAIFGAAARDSRPMVSGFLGSPKDATPADWNGYAWTPEASADFSGMNWYFTLATYRADTQGRYRRKHAQCAGVFGVLLDDVGTKARPLSDLAALPPSVLVETSAGNFQALYLFDHPVSDLAHVEALHDSLRAAGYCDRDASSPTTRNCRLPFGVNGKHTPPQPCRLVDWQPGRRYTIKQIVHGLALVPAPPRALTAARAAPTLDKWNSKTEVERAELVADLAHALAHLSAEEHKPWVSVGHQLRAELPEDVARPLWEDWSRRASTFTEEGLAQWETFDPDRTGYAAVFAAAAAAGWKNPRQRVEADPLTVGFGHGAALPAGASLVPLPPPMPVPVPLPFAEVPIADLATAPPDAQTWWVESILPGGHVTMLGGHGGAGKSTLALMLAAAVAAGRPFLGMQSRPGRVLVFSAEDAGPLVRRRLHKICRVMGLDPVQLAQSLRVLDATEHAPVLFTEQRINGAAQGAPTATYDALRQYVDAHAIDVLVVDNASDVYDGDEIKRASVRAFVRSLSLLVRSRGGAVMLLAHVDKATSRAGRGAGSESYSGSTAWHNSVRSRLFFTQADAGTWELRHEKSNLGRRRDPLLLVWPDDGLPQVLENLLPPPLPPADNLRAVLALIQSNYSRGEWMAPANNSPRRAGRVLADAGNLPPRLTAAAVDQIVTEADRAQLLEVEEYINDGRKRAKRWKLTGTGAALITAPSAPSAPCG